MITIYFNVDSCTLIQEEPFRKRLLKELVLLYIKKKNLNACRLHTTFIVPTSNAFRIEHRMAFEND